MQGAVMRHIFFKNCRRRLFLLLSNEQDMSFRPLRFELNKALSCLLLLGSRASQKSLSFGVNLRGFLSVTTAVSGIECVGTRQSFSERDIEEEKAFAHFRKARQILRFPSFSFLTTH